ncbi:uncharacterized protein EI90DRAFT_3155540 [Cantharellus anzutake]|uniref:uncharacterized protein n=1 Tax=Cantharellus anzutake TaxID=1750568 RepID=UPI0019046E56|nr:uncharacterized protein EI90DRAFT_3155540 [Cantharellus anzutake]KAF8328785.1 hypothetical protein EI90DRAFT_3155540 [Cantharellus anzutake]
MSSFDAIPDLQEAKAQHEFQRTRTLKADRASHVQQQPSRPSRRRSSSSNNAPRQAWRKLTPVEAQGEYPSSSRRFASAPNVFDSWDDELSRAYQDDGDHGYDSDVPEATWDSSSETEDMESDPTLLSDLILPQTEALGMLTSFLQQEIIDLSPHSSMTDFITISEYHLAQPAQHFQRPFPPSYMASPIHNMAAIHDSPIGPSLGLPEDPKLWVDDRRYSSTHSATDQTRLRSSNTVIIIQDSVW